MKPAGTIWRKIPFIKILSGLITGILVQVYISPDPVVWTVTVLLALPLLFAFFFLPFFSRYRLAPLAGMAAIILFAACGGLLAHKKDIRNNKDWAGHHHTRSATFYAIAVAPAEEKQNSHKITATLYWQYADGKMIPVRGKIFIYLRKGANTNKITQATQYGSRIIFKNELKRITGYGNPGGFDYERYCLLKGITHQVFLEEGDFDVLDGKKTKRSLNLIYQLRERIVKTIRKYIEGDKESGLAEALLIGYKNDLDKSLVQAYADTGVVHIIAISGLHVGLVYWLLLQVFYPLRKSKTLGWLSAILVIAGLWIFSFLAGAQPSILRAAVMFTCMVIEKEVSARSSIYNTIAFSAFILLCIDPFWLFDAGFQLSYAAVVSIIAFMKPVYNILFIRNKWIDQVWKLNAVTIAAQVFTIPLCLYYFHQFPNYFLITNFIAVPLSSMILFGEILLITVAPFHILAKYLGRILEHLIMFMNECIETIASFSFATWENLQVSVAQAIILMIVAAGISFGLTERSRLLLSIGIFSTALFFSLRSISFVEAGKQQVLIVYNVPRTTAIDLVHGRRSVFIGDSLLKTNAAHNQLYLQPARTLLRFSEDEYQIPVRQSRLFEFSGKKIWILDQETELTGDYNKPEIDLLILSKNPRLRIPGIARAVTVRKVVFDGSVPSWKSRYWKKDCDSLGIPWHDVSTDGAFVMTTR